MRGTLALLGGAVLLVAGAGATCRAAEALAEPVKLVRTLQLMQDQMAHGTLDSETARRALIDTIGARFLAAAPETWNDPRNVEAALLYVLSGGNPAILEKLPDMKDDAARGKLVAAVRAYATGSEEEAQKLWADIDVAALPIALVGPSALAKATLLAKDDPQQAMQFVNMARLESPGTLIEEAAVRRGIELAAKLKDAEQFEFFAIRYASRFPRSMYAEAFRHRFSEFYLAIASEKDGQVVPNLESILTPLARADRREIFLEIARVAVIDARLNLAKAAAEDAAVLSDPGSVEMRRAQLYRASAIAVSGDPAEGRADLAAAAEGELPARDRELLGAALAVVDQVERWPSVAVDKEPPPTKVLDGESSGAPADPTKDVVARAHDAVGAAQQLLADAGS